MNEWMAGLIGGLAGGAFVFLLRFIPMSPNYQDGEFRRHLSRDEKHHLQSGEIITKNHKAFTTIWRTSYCEGPLRVEKTADKKFRFTPFGDWQQIEPDGRISNRWKYTGVGREAVYTYYQPSGLPDMVTYTVPATINGDSVREERMVFFRLDDSRDTVAVRHSYEKYGKRFKEDVWSFDAQGKRPVPPGWKLERW